MHVFRCIFKVTLTFILIFGGIDWNGLETTPTNGEDQRIIAFQDLCVRVSCVCVWREQDHEQRGTVDSRWMLPVFPYPSTYLTMPTMSFDTTTDQTHGSFMGKQTSDNHRPGRSEIATELRGDTFDGNTYIETLDR